MLRRLKTYGWKQPEQLRQNRLPSRHLSIILRNGMGTGKIIIIPNSQGHSFFPVTIRRWNALPQNMKLNHSLYCFKTNLHTRNIKIKTFLAKLRLECSGLNLYSFFFQRKFNNSPLCIFGEVESTDHFLLHCNIF